MRAADAFLAAHCEGIRGYITFSGEVGSSVEGVLADHSLRLQLEVGIPAYGITAASLFSAHIAGRYSLRNCTLHRETTRRFSEGKKGKYL